MALDWNWPQLFSHMDELFGGLVRLDMVSILKPECMGFHRGVALAVGAAASSFWIVVLFVALWASHSSARATGQTAMKAKIVHFTVAIYSMGFPLIVMHAVPLMDWSPTYKQEGGGLDYSKLRAENNYLPHMNVPWYWALLPVLSAYWWIVLVAGIVPWFIYKQLLVFARGSQNNEQH